MDIARFKKLPIMGIVRGIDEHSVAPLVESGPRPGQGRGSGICERLVDH